MVLARVGSREITLQDVLDKIELQYPQLKDLEGVAKAKEVGQVLNLYVDELCWVQFGLEKGYDRHPRFRKMMELARDHLLSELVVDEEVENKVQPTEEELRQAYERMKEAFRVPERVRVRHIMTRTREEAERVRQRLLAGESWEKLAQEVSTEPMSARRGGYAGLVTPEGEVYGLGRVPEFNRQVLSLEVGEISPVFKTSKGWHVATVTERFPAGYRPLEEVRQTIAERILLQKVGRRKRELLDSLQTVYQASVDQEALKRYMRSVMTVEELLQEARSARDAQTKIADYEEILRRDPKDPAAPEALFMIGYLYAEELRDTARAKEALERVLKEYPESEVASSARWLLENMGRGEFLGSPEEVKRKARQGTR
jgi:tetratricopeptide (TPR) repeat protein